MAKRKKSVTKVTLYMPARVDLTKLKSGNALQFEVRQDHELLGTLSMGRGSVEWWPGGNKKRSLRKRWIEFADMLDEHMR